jgi:hypothetical protein
MVICQTRHFIKKREDVETTKIIQGVHTLHEAINHRRCNMENSQRELEVTERTVFLVS